MYSSSPVYMPNSFSTRMHSSCPFFINHTSTTEIYTLSLHDALPIFSGPFEASCIRAARSLRRRAFVRERSEEHTSELQSPYDLVCRLLLEKKKNNNMV